MPITVVNPSSFVIPLFSPFVSAMTDFPFVMGLGRPFPLLRDLSQITINPSFPLLFTESIKHESLKIGVKSFHLPFRFDVKPVRVEYPVSSFHIDDSQALECNPFAGYIIPPLCAAPFSFPIASRSSESLTNKPTYSTNTPDTLYNVELEHQDLPSGTDSHANACQR
jgi:hypothetical protein